MHLTSRGFSAALTLTLALLAGCTSSPDGAPAQTPSAAPAATSTASATPTADLAALPIQQLTGNAPAQMPKWKRGDDMKVHSVQTLEYLVSVARKAGIAVPTVNYAIYTGDENDVVDCKNAYIATTAKESGGANYCATLNGGQSGILLIPSNWEQAEPWDTEQHHSLYELIDGLAMLIDGATRSMPQFCMEGKLYASLVLADPKLKETVDVHLAPAGKLEYHPTEQWRNTNYARMVTGHSTDC